MIDRFQQIHLLAVVLQPCRICNWLCYIQNISPSSWHLWRASIGSTLVFLFLALARFIVKKCNAFDEFVPFSACFSYVQVLLVTFIYTKYWFFFFHFQVDWLGSDKRGRKYCSSLIMAFRRFVLLQVVMLLLIGSKVGVVFCQQKVKRWRGNIVM